MPPILPSRFFIFICHRMEICSMLLHKLALVHSSNQEPLSLNLLFLHALSQFHRLHTARRCHRFLRFTGPTVIHSGGGFRKGRESMQEENSRKQKRKHEEAESKADDESDDRIEGSVHLEILDCNVLGLSS